MYISTKLYEREKWVKLSISLNITLKAIKMTKTVIRLRRGKLRVAEIRTREHTQAELQHLKLEQARNRQLKFRDEKQQQ